MEDVPDRQERLPTGIPGFDEMSEGGLPVSRPTLLTGAPGTGKTVFGLQFLAYGVGARDEPAVFVTFEESSDDLRAGAASFGWPVADWEDQGMWRFVDASPQDERPGIVTGEYDLRGLLTRIRSAVEEVGARRVVLDSVSTLFSYLPNPAAVRFEMFRLRRALRDLPAIAIVTAERDNDGAQMARHDVEAFVADNVVVLRNLHEDTQRRRTMAIAKFRGTGHALGEVPFTITGDTGIVAFPLATMELERATRGSRRSTGVTELDDMLGGGVPAGSTLLISGATGTGKTLTACHFLDALADDEGGLFIGFEESRSQVLQDAAGWGMHLDELQEDGCLRLHCEYPESRSFENHLLAIRQIITEQEPARVVVDGLTSLQRIGSSRAFREFVLALMMELRNRQASSILTATIPAPLGAESPTQTQISSIADGVVLLRYLESGETISRVLAVLKMRGADHDNTVRQFEIGSQGMELLGPVAVPPGLLAGYGPLPRPPTDPDSGN